MNSPSQPPVRSAPGDLVTPARLAIFALLLLALLFAFEFVTRAYRARIDAYQTGLTRYAAERALAALERDDLDTATAEVDLLESERPFYDADTLLGTRHFSEMWEGPVLRNRVMLYEDLTAALLDRQMLPQARTVAAKTLLEFHSHSRALEMPNHWNLFYHTAAAARDWPAVFESAKILASHGIDRIPLPGNLEPEGYPVSADHFAHLSEAMPHRLFGNGRTRGPLYSFYRAEFEERPSAAYGLVANRIEAELPQLTNPIIRRRFHDLLHRSLLLAGRRAEARLLLSQLWGRNPATLDPAWPAYPALTHGLTPLDREPNLIQYFWRDRPEGETKSIQEFIDSFAGDVRMQIHPTRYFEQFKPQYFIPENTFLRSGDSVILHQSIGGYLDIEPTQPVRRLYIACESSVALGVYPILLVRFDDGPYTPVYCDSKDPQLIPIDCDLAPGSHRLEVLYLNDGGFNFRRELDEDGNVLGFRINEDRNVTLYRFILVYVEPQD